MNPDGTPDSSGSFWSSIQNFANGGVQTYLAVKDATKAPAAQAAANAKVTANGPTPVDQKTLLIGAAILGGIVLLITLRK